MPGITLVAYGAGTVVVKAMLKDATRKAKKVDAMAASKILLLSQSAYVLRMKKHSEKTTDTIPIPESILANTRHLLGLSFGVKFTEEQGLVHHWGDMCWSGTQGLSPCSSAIEAKMTTLHEVNMHNHRPKMQPSTYICTDGTRAVKYYYSPSYRQGDTP
jgi:hypothetical protein